MKYCVYIFILLTILVFQKSYSQFINWEKPENLSVLNTSKDEFAPFFDNKSSILYYNSTISGVSQLYWMQTNDSFDFGKPILHKSKLNNPKENRSYFFFCEDGTIYLSKFRLTSKFPVLNLAVSEIYRNNYSEPTFIKQLQCDCFVSHPTLSKDGRTLIFASNWNNKTNLDLFISYKNNDGVWSEPIELSEINSDGNEITPFLYNDSLLFFASDGLYGIGGYDIYYSEFIDGTWQKPVPLNDINTEFDESDLIMLENGFAFFASNRPFGTGGLDLYLLRPKINQIEERKNPLLIVKYSPLEIKAKRIVSYFSLDLSVPLAYSGDYFNFDLNMKCIDNEIEFDYTKYSPINYIFQIAFLYSKYHNDTLRVLVSKNFPLVKFQDDLIDFGSKVRVDKNRFIIIPDSSLCENCFKIDFKEKITLRNTTVQTEVPKLYFEFETENIPLDNELLVFLNNSHNYIKNTKLSSHKFSSEIDITECLENCKFDEALDFSFSTVIDNDTIPLSNLSVPILSSVTKTPIMKRKNDKIYFYYLLRISDNYDEFVNSNYNEINMIKQNYHIASSIDVFIDKLRYEKIRKMINERNLFPNKTNFIQTEEYRDDFLFEFPNHLWIRVPLNN